MIRTLAQAGLLVFAGIYLYRRVEAALDDLIVEQRAEAVLSYQAAHEKRNDVGNLIALLHENRMRASSEFFPC